MKYLRKKFKARIKQIKPEYGQCKVLYIDKYNTILHKRLYVKVKCKNCGKITSKSISVMKQNIKQGYVNTCGNYNETNDGRSRLYNIWGGIKERCNTITNSAYKDYGGRGIKMCDEWLNSFQTFKKWALNNGYADNLTIDRVDNNGNYEPNNCRWSTTKQQARNRRNNKIYTINGVTKCLAEWCEQYKICYQTVKYRLQQNWDIEKALTQPVKKNNHYSQYTYELKDVAPLLLQNLKGIDAVYIFNVLKYVWRYPFKNGSTDLKKALEYIQFLKEVQDVRD